MKIYQQLASKLNAMQFCQKNNNDWANKHAEYILTLIKNTAPSGSGIDCGTTFEFDHSTPNRLIFSLSYHHMNDNGMYDGWTDHSVQVTLDLASGFNLKVTGINRNEIKDYLAEVYYHWLVEEVLE